MYEKDKDSWFCNKCKKNILNCIDIDYHNNREHPDFNDNYVNKWYINGKPGLSPYD